MNLMGFPSTTSRVVSSSMCIKRSQYSFLSNRESVYKDREIMGPHHVSPCRPLKEHWNSFLVRVDYWSSKQEIYVISITYQQEYSILLIKVKKMKTKAVTCVKGYFFKVKWEMILAWCQPILCYCDRIEEMSNLERKEIYLAPGP